MANRPILCCFAAIHCNFQLKYEPRASYALFAFCEKYMFDTATTTTIVGATRGEKRQKNGRDNSNNNGNNEIGQDNLNPSRNERPFRLSEGDHIRTLFRAFLR